MLLNMHLNLLKKVIIRNVVSFFTLYTVKAAFLMTS